MRVSVFQLLPYTTTITTTITTTTTTTTTITITINEKNSHNGNNHIQQHVIALKSRNLNSLLNNIRRSSVTNAEVIDHVI